MTLDHARRAQRPAAFGVDPGWRDAADTMPIVRTTPGCRNLRRARTSILAALAVVVCGAATIEVAMTRPTEHVPAAAAIGVAAAASSATLRSQSDVLRGAVRLCLVDRQRVRGVVDAQADVEPSAHRRRRTSRSLEPDLVLLGSWTVAYVVGPANGQGANIVIPLRRLDGLVIRPGATFDFWTAVGEVTRRTGYRAGAIIVGHHVDPDGALAGGICTVSTALFDAAARAGLPITARTSHGGYLAKYPLGLDAAVAKGDHRRQTLAFRNDTTELDRDPDRQHARRRAGRSLRSGRTRAHGRVQRPCHQSPSAGARSPHQDAVASTRRAPAHPGPERRHDRRRHAHRPRCRRTPHPSRPLDVGLSLARRARPRRDRLTPLDRAATRHGGASRPPNYTPRHGPPLGVRAARRHRGRRLPGRPRAHGHRGRAAVDPGRPGRSEEADPRGSSCARRAGSSTATCWSTS